jgi:peptide/nickel transport system permease protein
MLWLVLSLLFLIFRLMPGDYMDLMLYSGASEESTRQIRMQWGLDEPLYIQYLKYIQNFLQGDPGVSFQTRQPVWRFVKMKLFNTLILVVPAISAAFIVGSIIGAIVGAIKDSGYEKLSIVMLLSVGSFPEFFIGIVLIIILSSWLGLFPPAGMTSPGLSRELSGTAWWQVYFTTDFASHYFLPFATIFLYVLKGPSLIMRTSVVEIIDQDFVYYHEITGLPYVNRLKHIGRHAILPVLTLYPVALTQAISGMVLVEVVFNWPGIGFALVQSIMSRDFPVIQFIFFLTAAIVIVGNFIVDILYTVIDPRIELDKE